ncbi:MAG: O-antigen ligase family protein [Syntrophobacteraceae bacterium]
MRYLLFFIVFFGLPNCLWVVQKFSISPQAIPLGLVNLLLILAAGLWIFSRTQPPHLKNPIREYTIFTVLVVLWVGMAILTGFDRVVWNTLQDSKREISKLLLFFLPLGIIKNRRDFAWFLGICLLVHFVIGLEVLRSGVLAGAHFNDSKRGAGPFGVGYWGTGDVAGGSDVAGAYLAQMIMFFLAFVVYGGIQLRIRIFCAAGAAILLAGTYATYARGALLGVAAGMLVMTLIRKINTTRVILSVIISLVAFAYVPNGVFTRFHDIKSENGKWGASTAGRLDYYDAALQIIEHYPLGVGTGQIRSAMQEYTGRAKGSMGKHVDPHNGFLYAACEYGIIGLIIFIALLWKMFAIAQSLFNDESMSPIYRVYSLGMTGMIASLVVCNMFYANFFKDMVLGTIAIHFGMLAFIKAVSLEKSASFASATSSVGVNIHTAYHHINRTVL